MSRARRRTAHRRIGARRRGCRSTAWSSDCVTGGTPPRCAAFYDFFGSRAFHAANPSPQRPRSVNVPEAAGRTARFRYADLCEQPLGRDDYLLIAQSFDRVFVDDIPMIRYSTRDSGERFRIMIDVFYEAGTSIYARAAAPIAELVNLEDHDMQPFLRTQSRLMEMQRLSYREAKAPIAA